MTATEVAEALGVPPATLRHWSTAFAVLLSPELAQRMPAIVPHYTDQDLAILRQIQVLVTGNITMAQVFEHLAILEAAFGAQGDQTIDACVAPTGTHALICALHRLCDF